MAIKIGVFKTKEDPDGHQTERRYASLNLWRSGELYRGVLEYLHRTLRRGDRFTAFPVLLPMMHQSIELFAKALATEADLTFSDRHHNTLRIVERYRTRVPVFEELQRDPQMQTLVRELQNGYIDLRYRNYCFQFDEGDWPLFFATAEKLRDALQGWEKVRTPVVLGFFPDDL